MNIRALLSIAFLSACSTPVTFDAGDGSTEAGADTIDVVLADAPDTQSPPDVVDALIADAPCGIANGPCCAGSICGTGSMCVDGNCSPRTYEGCDPSGLQCTGGFLIACETGPSSSGDSWCGAYCVSSAGECPDWAGSDRDYTRNCYILQGQTQGRCFIDCQTGDSCPSGTTCRMLPNSLGEQVRVCAP